jgi:hypothetical protein
VLPPSVAVDPECCAWFLLPMAFVILTFIAAMVISLVVWVVIGRFGVVGVGGGAYNVMPFAVVPGLAMPGGGKGSETDSMIDAPSPHRYRLERGKQKVRTGAG